jgi:SAM-dependent methyltransferase
MSVNRNLQEMERAREAYWLRYPATSPTKLRWRAHTVRHSFQVLPGETILELGAGSGLWTEHLTAVLHGENPITAAVFNCDMSEAGSRKGLANTTFVHVSDLATGFPGASFDYIVGTAILSHNAYAENLAILRRLLKPGGQILFFEANFWNPQVALKNSIKPIGRWTGNAPCQVAFKKARLSQIASDEGYTKVSVIPYDIVHPCLPRSWIDFVSSVARIFEHTPVLREVSGTLYIWAQKPQNCPAARPLKNLACHGQLFDSTSVVVPCHNEQMNIAPLVDALTAMYGEYIYEIILVNDNSTDCTAGAIRAAARKDPRVKLVDRGKPNGVGRALRDGYAAARGRYILTMDCDFVPILPGLRDLFDVIAAGHDGAIGSRFSHESILVNYPFVKIAGNRGFHVLLSVFMGRRIRDISNNLKLYRLTFETGLKPLLAGYDLKEVPVSWINRSAEMGKSSFHILKVAPSYAFILMKLVWSAWCGRKTVAEVHPE